MEETIRISARNLGEVRKKDFCPRCFWLARRFPLNKDHPFHSPMPGLVSTLDSYIKRVMETTFNQRGRLPSWLVEALGDLPVVTFLKPKTWEAPWEDAVLIGRVDALWELEDRALFIADYKAAKLTESQEDLFPLYEAQLKAYAYLAERNGKQVRGLALIYMEPQDYKEEPSRLLELCEERMTMYFRCVVKRVEGWSREEVEGWIRQTRDILRQPKPPAGREGCPGCARLEAWLRDLMGAMGKAMP